MRRKLLIGGSLIVLSIGATAFQAVGQDLGSSNKLFGGSSATKKSTAKKSAPQPKPKAKPKTVASAKPSQKATKKPVTTRKVTTGKKVVTANTPVVAAKTPKKDAAQKPTTASEKVPVKTAPRTPIDDTKYEQLIEDGNAARDDRDYSSAESSYSAASKVDPRDARSFLGLGNLYADQQRWEHAEKAYRAAIAIDNDYSELLTALSFVLTRPLSAPNISERYTEAETLARRALKIDPKSWLAYDQLGVSLELQGEIGSETENAYCRSIELDADFAPAYAHLARLLKKKGRPADAIANYNSASYKATTVGTKLLVVDAMHSDGKFAESVPLLSVALLMDPRNPTALAMLGRAQTVLGNFPDAEKHLKRSIEVAPSGVISYALLATLYIKQQRPELAENVLVRSIAFLTPFEKRRIASLFENLGDAYFKSMRSSSAISAYKRAGELDPDRVSIAGKLARAR